MAITEWCVCLGVLYGTEFWQVGDSKKQNGSFNTTMIDVKRKLLVLKRRHCLNGSIDKRDLILLINIVWNNAFARTDKNRRDITDRGWGPYNRSILSFSLIRATMIESNYLKDIKYHVDLSPSSPVSNITNYLFSDNLFSSISGCSYSGSINLNTGLAALVIDTIIQHEDRLIKRERINNKQNNGKRFHDGIIDAKNISTRLCFKTTRLDLENQYYIGWMIGNVLDKK